jgi:hypothetical protein
MRTVWIAKKIEPQTKCATRRRGGIYLKTTNSVATTKQKTRDRSIEKASLVFQRAGLGQVWHRRSLLNSRQDISSGPFRKETKKKCQCQCRCRASSLVRWMRKGGRLPQKDPSPHAFAAQNSGDHALTMKASVAFTGEAGRPTWDH